MQLLRIHLLAVVREKTAAQRSVKNHSTSELYSCTPQTASHAQPPTHRKHQPSPAASPRETMPRHTASLRSRSSPLRVEGDSRDASSASACFAATSRERPLKTESVVPRLARRITSRTSTCSSLGSGSAAVCEAPSMERSSLTSCAVRCKRDERVAAGDDDAASAAAEAAVADEAAAPSGRPVANKRQLPPRARRRLAGRISLNTRKRARLLWRWCVLPCDFAKDVCVAEHFAKSAFFVPDAGVLCVSQQASPAPVDR